MAEASIVVHFDPADVDRLNALIAQQVEIIALLQELLKRQAPVPVDALGPFLNDQAATIYHTRPAPEGNGE